MRRISKAVGKQKATQYHLKSAATEESQLFRARDDRVLSHSQAYDYYPENARHAHPHPNMDSGSGNGQMVVSDDSDSDFTFSFFYPAYSHRINGQPISIPERQIKPEH